MEKLFDIIFEDSDLLVVNKPAGLVCHPTKSGEMSSLIGRARLYLSRDGREGCEEKSKVTVRGKTDDKFPLSAACGGEGRGEVVLVSPHLINRLDRETSGVVLIAKNSAAAGELGKLLESRAVEKEYLAIVHGHVREERGLIDTPLGRDERSIVAVKDCVRPDGAPAQTEFFVERRLSVGVQASACPDTMKRELQPAQPSSILNHPFSLLQIVPRTGRKHQIRIHLAHLGHPIVGDKLYGHDEDCYLALAQNRLTAAQRARLIFENHALHARSIKFIWRSTPVAFSCEPEPWFSDFVGDDARSL